MKIVLLIYGLTTIAFSFEKILTPLFLGVTFLLSILFGVLIGEAKNRDWFSSLFRGRTYFLSSQDKIFSIKATEKLFGKWHVIGLKNGKELCGIVREFNTLNNEMLVEDARWVIRNNNSCSLSHDSSWLYFPPNQDIEYIRTIEKAQEVSV